MHLWPSNPRRTAHQMPRCPRARPGPPPARGNSPVAKAASLQYPRPYAPSEAHELGGHMEPAECTQGTSQTFSTPMTRHRLRCHDGPPQLPRCITHRKPLPAIVTISRSSVETIYERGGGAGGGAAKVAQAGHGRVWRPHGCSGAGPNCPWEGRAFQAGQAFKGFQLAMVDTSFFSDSVI